MSVRAAVVALASLAVSAPWSAPAHAQSPPAAPVTLAVGDWQFAPSVDVRARGEYRRDPVDVGGLDQAGNASPRVRDAVAVASRARVGLGVERAALRAQVTLQDARAWGASAPRAPFTAAAGIGAYEAFAEVHSASPTRPSFLRIGRQAVRWGDGMLLGIADWSPTGRSLDAARGVLVIGNWDVELLAAILDSPRPLGAPFGDVSGPARGGTELYGFRAGYSVDPLFRVELAALARVARSAGAVAVASRFALAQAAGEAYTASLRVAGDRGAIAYALEGAGQLGRASAIDAGVDRRAFAAALHVAYRFERVALSPVVRVGGSLATGDLYNEEYTQFDPILPDVHTSLGAMDIFALSNLVEAHARVTITPHDDVRATGEYRYARLATSDGEWLNAYLVPVGTAGAAASGDVELGHEIDASVTWQPWTAVALHAGYSALVLGDGAMRILAARERGRRLDDGTVAPSSLAHLGYVQITLRAP